MADTNSIAKVSTLAKQGPGRATFAVKRSTNQLVLDRGQSTTVAEVVTTNGVFTNTAVDLTLTAKDTDKTIVITSSTSRTITLPATAAGLRFRVVNKAVTAGAGHAIAPVAADRFIWNAKADAATLVNSGATDVEGDQVELVGDGVDGWYVVSKVGTWA